MNLVNMTCPNCSAKLRLDKDKKQAICDSCGTTFLIDNPEPEKALTKEQIDNQNRIEKINKIAQINQSVNTRATQNSSGSNNGYTGNHSSYSQTNNTKSSQRNSVSTVLWVIGFVFFLPIAASVWIYKSDLPEKSKSPLIVSLWLCVLFFAFIFGSAEPADNSNETITWTQNTTMSSIEEQRDDSPTTISEVETEYHRDEIINEIIIRYNDITEYPLTSDQVGSRQMNSQAYIYYSNGVVVNITHASLSDSLVFSIEAEHADDTVLFEMLAEWCMAIDPTLSYEEITEDYNAVKNKDWDDTSTYYINTMTIRYWDTQVSNGLHSYRVLLDYPNISEA